MSLPIEARGHLNRSLPRKSERTQLRTSLEAFRDQETGHIILTREQAAELLLDYLLSEHRRIAEESPHPIDLAFGSWSDPVVEALDIARKAEGKEKIDLGEVLVMTFLDERDARNRRS